MQIVQPAGSHSFLEPITDGGRQNVYSQATGRTVARALCRVLLGKGDNYFPWLEKVLEHASTGTEYKKLENLSVMIIDAEARIALKNRPHSGGTLYDKLSEQGVTFVDVDEVMTFLETKFQSNPVAEMMGNLRKLRFFDGGSFRFNHLLSEALKAICPSYVFSLNNLLESVAVVDADSFIPLLPIKQKVLSKKSEHPICLKADMEISMTTGKKYIVNKAITDIDFLRYFFSPSDHVKRTVLETRINYAFSEVRSQQVADKKAEYLLHAFRQLMNFPWSKTDTDNDALDATFGFEKIVERVSGLLTNICYLRCDESEYSPIQQCSRRRVCSSSAPQFEYQLLVMQINQRLVDFSFLHLLSEIERIAPSQFHFCCSENSVQVSPSICNNKYAWSLDRCKSFSGCKPSFDILTLSGSEPMGYSLLFNTKKSRQLSHFFCNPSQDWGLRITIGRYLWNPDSMFHKNPVIAVSLGKEHAQEVVLNGNISAITSLQDRSRQPWGELIPESDMLNEARAGSINGIVAGFFDDFFSRTPLPDYSLIYKTGRGYLFGGGVGMALGLGEHIYDRYIEPALPETGLKTYLKTLLSKGFMVTAALQGRVVSAVCTSAGYILARRIGQKIFPPVPHIPHNIPQRKYKY